MSIPLHAHGCEQEDALRLRRQWLEAVWHGSTEHTAAYSRDQLLSSYAISMDEVQWAANVVRSRCELISYIF